MLVHVSPYAPRTSSAARQHIAAAWRRLAALACSTYHASTARAHDAAPPHPQSRSISRHVRRKRRKRLHGGSCRLHHRHGRRQRQRYRRRRRCCTPLARPPLLPPSPLRPVSAPGSFRHPSHCHRLSYGVLGSSFAGRAGVVQHAPVRRLRGQWDAVCVVEDMRARPASHAVRTACTKSGIKQRPQYAYRVSV